MAVIYILCWALIFVICFNIAEISILLFKLEPLVFLFITFTGELRSDFTIIILNLMFLFLQINCSQKGNASFRISKNFGINVTDVNEAPFNLNITNTMVKENQPNGALVGTLTADDPDNDVNILSHFVYGKFVKVILRLISVVILQLNVFIMTKIAFTTLEMALSDHIPDPDFLVYHAG